MNSRALRAGQPRLSSACAQVLLRVLGAGPPPECAGAGTDAFRPARLGSERPARVEGRGFRLDPSMWLGPNHRHTRQTPHSSVLPACPLLQVLGTQPGLALSLSGTPQWLPDPPAVSSKEALTSPAGGRDWGALNRAPSAACLPNPTLSEPSPPGKVGRSLPRFLPGPGGHSVPGLGPGQASGGVCLHSRAELPSC